VVRVKATERTIIFIKVEVLKEAIEALTELEAERAKEPSVPAQRSRFGIKDSIRQIRAIIEACEARMENDNDE
jgi:hypothetical protein